MSNKRLLLLAFISTLVVGFFVLRDTPSGASVGEKSGGTGSEIRASLVERPVGTGAAVSPSPAGVASATGVDALREGSRLSRTLRGEWAERVPSLDEYAPKLPAEHVAVLAAFRSRFPDLDPSDAEHFAEATLRHRTTYGDELDEKEGSDFTAWLLPVERMQAALVAARAAHVGIVVSGSEPGPDGEARSFTLVGFDGVQPRYTFTQNAAAAVSTNVHRVRMNAAFDPFVGDVVNGSGLYVNVNDHGTIYDTHTEFQLPNSGGTRVVYKEVNDAGDRSHMTHCAGTIGAWGYTSNLTGMAPRVWIRSFIQQSTSDVSGLGMLWPGQKNSTTNPRNGETEMKSVMGSTSLGSEDTNTNRGVYTSTAASFDTVLRDYPYYSHFYAAVNDGSAFTTLGTGWPISKNNFVIGSVSDVVRDANGNLTGGGLVSGFSSRGPTFDGRIKPDFTANGESLLSPNGATGSGNKSGTSMATPNASGTATVLIDYIARKFPGHHFRSSTLKALFANTTDDRGNAGPDYTYGWGLINLEKAAALVKRHAEQPAARVVVEDQLAQDQTWSRAYVYDGSGPVRVTLAWIDPAGPSQSPSLAVRDPRLVNNLNLRLISAGGVVHQPFVMPFTTGNATYAAFSPNLHGAVATTGNNITDNVEQVLISAPPAGAYTLQITHGASLQNGNPQRFSLAVSGLSAAEPEPFAVTSVSPTTGDATDAFVLTVNGTGFGLGYDVVLRRAGSPDVPAYGETILSSQIVSRVDTAALAKGYWDIVVRAPDGLETVLPNAFLLPLGGGSGVRANLYANTFESGASGLSLGSGWSLAAPAKGAVSGPAAAQQGANALVTHAGAEYPGNVVTHAVLPAVSTVGFTGVRLEFQRWLGVRKQGSSTDYARVQYSLDGYAWTDVVAHSNLIESQWSAQTYALPAAVEGKGAVHLRFSLETDATNHSFGWNIDDLKITGASSSAAPPVFASSAPSVATVGQAFSYLATVTDDDTSGASLVFAATGLPPGLSLANNGNKTATLAGTPTTSGAYPIGISVTDGGYTTHQNFTLTVYPVGGNTAPRIDTTSLPDAFVGSAYAGTLQATDADGHPLGLTIGAKPAWLSFTDHGDGTATLGGTPPVGANGVFNLTFRVHDGFDTVSKSLALTVRSRSLVGFSPAVALVSEGGGALNLSVTRADGSFGPVTVAYASAAGSATAGVDYTSVSGTLSWADGDNATKTITVPILQDALSEIDETFTVTLSALTGIADIGAGVATVTIDDDENNAVAYVEVTDADCAEASSNDGVFTITRTGSTVASMTVNYTLSGTATNATDYQSRTGLVTIAANATTATVSVDPVDDTAYEGDEAVVLTIDPGVGYNVGEPASAEITLKENDKPTVSVSLATTTVTEDVGTVLLTVTRTGSTEVGPLTVNYAVSGTGAVGADYAPFGGSITIPRFEESRNVEIPILNDNLVEAAETIVVTLSANSAYTVASAPGNAATITVRDDSEPVMLVLTASDGTASEPDKADGNGAYLITRWGNVNPALTVNLLAPSGSATSGSDYVALPATVDLPAGASTATVTLSPLQDTVAEPDETVVLSLASGAGYTVGNSFSASINLYDDEPVQVRLEVGDGKCIELSGTSTADNGAFIFRRLGNRVTALTVNYTVSGTAANGTDYNSLGGTISLGANAGSATLTVTPINDAAVEGPETVIVTLTTGTGYAVAASPDNVASLDIREDETIDVTVSVQDAVCSEGATPDNGNFRITRSSASASPLLVNYTVSGTAADGVDYVSIGGSATIPANGTFVDVPVTPLDDGLLEGAESVVLTLGFNGAAHDLGDTRVATLWIRDDEAPVLSLAASDASAAEPEDGLVDEGRWTITATSAPTVDLVVNYTVSGGSNGLDYDFLSGVVTLPAGQTSVDVALVPIDDELVEAADTVGLTLQQGSNYSVATTSAVNVVIAASDTPAVRVYAAVSSASEGSLATGQFRVEADKILTSNTNLLYFMSGTATNGTDYTTLTGIVQISAGSNTASITLTPVNDTDSEGAETALLTLTDSAAYTVAPGGRSAAVTIADDEADGSLNLVVSPAALTLPEGSTAVFAVALDSAPASDLTVSTTALAGGDSDLAVLSGATLIFTSSNWSTPQLVTLSAAADVDATAGTATFLVSAAAYPTVRVLATEADAQAAPAIRLVSPELSPLALPDLTDRLELIVEATDTVGVPSLAWSQVSGPGTAAFVNASSASTAVSFPVSGDYVLRATATDADSQTAAVDLRVHAGGASAAYSLSTLGVSNYEPAARIGVGSVTLDGGGGDLSGASESGAFFTAPLSGNFTLTARVASLRAVETGYTLNAAAKAGLVVRESTTAGARMAFEGMSADNNSRYIYRSTPGASLSASNTGSLAIPYWVRLVRNGTTVQAFRSADGATWSQQGSNQTISMADPLRVGFAVASGNVNSSQPVAVFDNINGLPASNAAPQIDPGLAPWITVGLPAALQGSVTDDALPAGGGLSSVWTVVSAPPGAQVTFANANAAATTATFDATGAYVLRLQATDGPTTVWQDLALTVNAPAVPANLVVAPATATIPPESTRSFSAVVYDQYGQVMADQVIAWTLSGGGSVDGSGLVTAAATEGGPHTLTATSGGLSGTASLTVLNQAPTISDIPDQVVTQNVATGLLAFAVGDEETAPASLLVTATSSNQFLLPDANLVLGGSGSDRTLTASPAANQSGTATVTVTVGDGAKSASDTFTLTVQAGVVTSVVVSPASATVQPGGTRQFTASVLDQNGSPMDPQPTVSWTASGSGTVNSAGLFTASGSVGSATVSASVGAVSGSASVSVANTAPSVTITSPGVDALKLPERGDSLVLAAAATDAEVSPSVVWSQISGPGIATFADANSAATSVSFSANGAYVLRVTATDGLLTATDEITVGVETDVSAAGAPKIVQLNFADGTDGAASAALVGGSTWNTLVSKADAPVNTDPDLLDLRDSDNAGSGIALTWVDGFGFASGSRAENGITAGSGTAADGLSSYTTAGLTYTDGARLFPWAVSTSYAAVHQSTDGYAALTLSSVSKLHYTFWVLSSFDHANPASAVGEFNVGGAVSAVASNRVTFTGGTTLSLNGVSNQGSDDKADSSETSPYTLKYKVGKLTGGESVYNSATGKHEITFQIGDADTSSSGAYLNGLIISAAEVVSAGEAPRVNPGPAPAALVGQPAALAGSASDDGGAPTVFWSVVSGPGSVTFADASAAGTTAIFGSAGSYVLRLRASDASAAVFEDLAVAVSSSANTAPTIGAIADQNIPANGDTGALAFAVGDAETAASGLLVTAVSSNPALVPNTGAALALGGADAARSLTVTPAANQTGLATITVTVDDGGLTTQTAFTVTVAETLASWLSAQPGVGALTAAGDDPDQDGLPNLLEYAFDLDAGVPDASSQLLAPGTARVTDATRLTLTFTPYRVAGLRYEVLASGNLIDWSAPVDVTSQLVSGQPYTHTDSEAAGARRFLRLRISVAP